MTQEDKIKTILEQHFLNRGPSYNPLDELDDAAEAIAALYKRALLILELLAECGDDSQQVGECIKAAKELLEQENEKQN